MNERLKQFLAAENISQSQFADTIKVVRASVSHVLAGRNNPGYDFIKAIMNSYPNLNIEWLMLGKGKMYKDSLSEPPQIQDPIYKESTDALLFSYEEEKNEERFDLPLTAASAQQEIHQRKVSKVIIFFDDGSYQEMGN